MKEILDFTVSEFWEVCGNSNDKEMTIPIMDLLCKDIDPSVKDMLFYSEFRYIHMTNEGDVFKIYNPYGREYECYSNTEIGYVILDLFNIIHKRYDSMISDIYISTFHNNGYVLSPSEHPNEYEYFKHRSKCIIGKYEADYYLDSNNKMHIYKMVKK